MHLNGGRDDSQRPRESVDVERGDAVERIRSHFGMNASFEDVLDDVDLMFSPIDLYPGPHACFHCISNASDRMAR
ncbi:MAG: hypothetical protein DMF93_08395 [Acidobacteria bacterium]|nr:MAG: hypothetical protein DMF93_08395 [Acidobacteriota bacterium]